MSEAALLGKVVWIDMDADHGLFFAPRKGVIVALLKGYSQKEEVVVELLPAPFLLTPFPRKLTHILLRYSSKNTDDIHRTFRVGDSFAEVLRIKRPQKLLKSRVVNSGDVSHIGHAGVYPWPLPSVEDVKNRISAGKGPSLQ